MMKNGLILMFSFFLFSSAKAEKKIVDSKITEVTVYPVGAMIEREVSVPLSSGNNLVVFDNLTHAIDPNTIQVGGKGNFEILSVKFENYYPYAKTKPKGIQAIEDSLKVVRDERYILEGENKALDEEYQMILANKKIGSGNSSVSSQEMLAMANFYRQRLNNISAAKLKNQNARTKALAEESRLNSTLSGMNQYKYEQVGRIVVETTGKVNTQAKFTFSFFTHLAGWFPHYNIKGSTGQDQIDVDYHAYVTQTTGNDWKNVDLVLSTSRPTYNNQKPEIHPWYLSFSNSRFRSKSVDSYGNAAPQLAESPMEDAASNVRYENGEYVQIEKESIAGYSEGQKLLNALNTSYKISQKYTVVSNNSRKQVFIKSIQIPAEFNHYSVPSMEKEAFLTASLADWSRYDLVPGNATLFYNNTYVGKSYVFSNTTDDTLQISLGRDQGVNISHEKVQDLCVTKKIGSNTRKNFVYKMTLKNTKPKAVTIVVYDRVPVSKVNEIVVTLGDLAGAELDKDTGILKWVKTISAGESVSIQFDYEVKYPKDKASAVRLY